MVQKLRHLWGRVEIRVLVLLVFCFLLAGLALAVAQTLKASSSESPFPTVSTWDDLVKQYLNFREHNYALVVPGWWQTEEFLKEYSFEELQKEPDWYWTFNEGVYVFDDDSELARQIKSGTELVIYEDMAKEELVVLSAPGKEGGEWREEIVYTAPKCPELKKGEDYERYLTRELSQRRIVWQVTLKSRSLAEKEAAEAEAAQKEAQEKDGGGGGGMMMLGLEEYSNHLWVSIRGPEVGLTNLEIAAHIPAGFESPIEIFTCTNLLNFWWTLAETNVLTEGTDTVYWTYRTTEAETGPVFVTIGNAVIDSDGDGIVDAREKFLYHTDPELSDTDGDELPDGWEIANGLNPLSSQGNDGAGGDMDGDGLSNLEECGVGANPWQYDTVIVLGPDDLYEGGGMLLMFGPGRGIQYRSLSAQRSKCGFLEYINASTPPKYYLTETTSWHGEGNDEFVMWWALYSRFDSTATVDSITCQQSATCDQMVRHVEIDMETSQFFCVETNDYSCEFYNPYWEPTWQIDTTNQTSRHKFYHYDASAGGSADCDGWREGVPATYEQEWIIQLSTEYLTSMLLANAANDLGSCGALEDLEWGEGRSNSVPAGCETGSAATAASRYLNTNEDEVALTKIGYRFRVANLETGQIYRLNWVECFTPEGSSTTTVLNTHTTVFRGTGGTQALESAESTIDPPQSDGVIEPVVFKVDSITPNSACNPQEIDDQDGNPNTRIFLVPVTNSGEVTVTAAVSPDWDESTLPACMTLQGGNGSMRLERTVSRTTPSKTVFTFDCCGSDSGLRTTLYVYDAALWLFADEGTAVWEWPWDFNVGHAWWGAQIDSFSYELVPQDVHNYANELGGYWPQQYGDPSGPGEVRLDTGAGGQHSVTGSKRFQISFDHFINALAFFKEMYELPSTYNFFDHNCTDVAVQQGEHGEVYTISTYGVTSPEDLSDWLNSN